MSANLDQMTYKGFQAFSTTIFIWLKAISSSGFEDGLIHSFILWIIAQGGDYSKLSEKW